MTIFPFDGAMCFFDYMMMLLSALSKQLLSFAQLSEGSMDGYGQAGVRFPWDKEQLEVRDAGTVRWCLRVPSDPFSLP